MNLLGLQTPARIQGFRGFRAQGLESRGFRIKGFGAVLQRRLKVLLAVTHYK